MSLHYLVKLEMFIGHVELLLEETPEFIPPQLWPQNLSDVNPVDYSVWRVLQEKMYKIRITDLSKPKQRLRTELAKLEHVVIAAAIRQWRRR